MMDNKTTPQNEENEPFGGYFESIPQQQPEEWPSSEFEAVDWESDHWKSTDEILQSFAAVEEEFLNSDHWKEMEEILQNPDHWKAVEEIFQNLEQPTTHYPENNQ